MRKRLIKYLIIGDAIIMGMIFLPFGILMYFMARMYKKYEN